MKLKCQLKMIVCYEKVCRKYFYLVAVRKINFDDYSASKFAPMTFQTGGTFFEATDE